MAEEIKHWSYGNTLRYNNHLCYTVVPKCASTVIINQLNLTEKYKSTYSKKFTFIRHPYDRLKGYLWQNQQTTQDQIENKINCIIENFDNNDEHVYPYSIYIKFEDFDFIGLVENFDKDIRKIVDDKLADSIQQYHNKTMSNKTDGAYTRFIEKVNNQIHKKKQSLSNVYKNDFELYEKVKHAY